VAEKTVRFINVNGAQAYHVFKRGNEEFAAPATKDEYKSLGERNAAGPKPPEKGDVWVYSIDGPAFDVGEPAKDDCLILDTGDAILVNDKKGKKFRDNWGLLTKEEYNPTKVGSDRLVTSKEVPTNLVAKVSAR